MGISNAVGLAAAEAHMAATYNKPPGKNFNIASYRARGRQRAQHVLVPQSVFDREVSIGSVLECIGAP